MKILKVADIFTVHESVFYKKFLISKLPLCLSDIIVKQNDNVRSCHSSFFLKPPVRTKTESAKACIRHHIPLFVNNYDRNFILEISSLSIYALKSRLKKILLSSYESNCNDSNCYVCLLGRSNQS